MASRISYDPTPAERYRIAMLWQTGHDTADIGVAVVLAEHIVCRVLSEQREDRRRALTVGASA